MRYKEFLAKLNKGKISPVYIFEGKENYLKKEAVQKLRRELVPKSEDFNFQILNATSHTAKDILGAAYQLPFNSKWNLLVVEEANKLSSRDENMIIDYLKEPVNSTCLVLLGEKFDNKSKLYNFLKRKNKVVFFYPLTEIEVINWIKDKVEGGEKTITDEAAFELYKRVGEDLFLLQNEIAKLLSFVHPESCIKQSHVIQLAGESVQENIFGFLEAFREKNLPVALRILSRLFLQGEKHLVVGSMLGREVRVLFSLKLAGPKLTPHQACSFIFKRRTGYTSFFLKKAKNYIEAAEKFTIPELLFAQRRILNMEYSIKKGREEADIAIQKAVIDILSYPSS